jgi:hypothetical protein
MADQLLPTKRTAISRDDYVRACVRGMLAIGEGVPSEAAVAVSYAQYWIETGGAACWCFNIGNVKHTSGDGYDYLMLNGVWEGESPAAAAQLIASGQAVADTSASHAKSVGAGRVSVIFNPPHPATWFRAFASLDEGMTEHLGLLSKRFGTAWPALLAGDYVGFAVALHAQGYFTASADAYAAGMRTPYNALIASSTYEELVATLDAPIQTQPEDVADGEALRWDWEESVGSGGVIHPMPEWPSYRDEPPDEVA